MTDTDLYMPTLPAGTDMSEKVEAECEISPT